MTVLRVGDLVRHRDSGTWHIVREVMTDEGARDTKVRLIPVNLPAVKGSGGSLPSADQWYRSSLLEHIQSISDV